MADLRTAPPSLENRPGYALAQAFRALRHALDDALRELDLTTPQWGALTCLQSCEWRTGAEMARLQHLTPQTMHTILHNLESAGLVVREPHPQHGTLLRVCLTELGHERLDEAARCVDDVEERMLNDLSGEERAMLMNLLTRCTRSLLESGPLPPADSCEV
jgi:DNA-binding MarR family transcriptional regulator